MGMTPQIRIALKVFWLLFTLACHIVRLWILRRRIRTAASIAADVCATLAWIMLLVNTGMLMHEDLMYLEWYKKSDEEKVTTFFSHPLFNEELRVIHYVMIFTYFLGLWILKAGFVAIYYEVFRRLKDSHRYMLYGLTAWTVSSFSSLILLVLLACPIHENIELVSTCNVMTSEVTLYANFIVNVVNQALILAFPFTIIRGLKLNLKERFGFFFVCLVGFLSMGAATARFVQMYFLRQKMAGATFSDISAIGDMILLVEDWSFWECWLAFFAFCLPAFKVFVVQKQAAKRHDTMMLKREQALLDSVIAVQRNPSIGTRRMKSHKRSPSDLMSISRLSIITPTNESGYGESMDSAIDLQHVNRSLPRSPPATLSRSRSRSNTIVTTLSRTRSNTDPTVSAVIRDVGIDMVPEAVLGSPGFAVQVESPSSSRPGSRPGSRAREILNPARSSFRPDSRIWERIFGDGDEPSELQIEVTRTVEVSSERFSVYGPCSRPPEVYKLNNI